MNEMIAFRLFCLSAGLLLWLTRDSFFFFFSLLVAVFVLRVWWPISNLIQMIRSFLIFF